ncbi:hypothetical protein MHU86_2396 [Fragilaria crotonensis]|nr:hypothetical protein MHU86_2396 [Fragilaria crotonensis]
MLEASDEWELLSKATQRTEKPSLPIPRTFEQFIAQLDPWEEDLLRYTSTSYDPRMTVLELQDGFFAGCDGSSKHNTQGAFGWMISAPTGERMASGNGPSRGATVDSYRAECSGMLAILRFLIRLAEYSEMFGEWTGTIGTDSQSLLDRLFGKQKEGQEPLEYVATHLQPLDVLTPEWDLLIEIQASLRRLPDIRLQYVKGHQDNDTPYQRLSLMSQLNVDADKLATRYQEEFGMSRPHVLMSPNGSISSSKRRHGHCKLRRSNSVCSHRSWTSRIYKSQEPLE